MRKRLRLFFLCLLIFSLPVQSIAGIAMFECGMSHHPEMDSSAQQGEMLTWAMMGGPTHDAKHAHDSQAAQYGQSDEGCGNVSDHQRSGCKVCGGCSIGAYAPAPVLAITAVEETVSAVQQFSLSSFTGHIPARIERPPRAA